MLPFLNDEVIGRKMPLLRTRDIKPGLGGILRDNSRIKEFRLQDAILHSYIYDIRFISALCVLLGFSIWCTFAPEPLVLQPLSLSADPKIEYLNNIVTDTYVNKICSSHPGDNISLPCSCGSPLNNETKILFPEQPFDPLGINKVNPARIKAIAIYFVCIVLVLSLSESASQHGVYLNL